VLGEGGVWCDVIASVRFFNMYLGLSMLWIHRLATHTALKEITLAEDGSLSPWILPIIHGSYQQVRFCCMLVYHAFLVSPVTL
jgi:hypothetical protein